MSDLTACIEGDNLRKCGDNFKEMYRFTNFMRETPGNLVMFVDAAVSTFAGYNPG